MILKRAFTLFLCFFMIILIFMGPVLLHRYRVDYNKSYDDMKAEIHWRGVITVWDYPRLNTTNGTKLSWISSKIKQFEKLHPGVYIDFKELDVASGATLLKAAANTGAYPDVAPIGSDFYFMYEGMLENLNPYITEAEKSDFIPSALESATYKGSLYGLPWMMTGYTLLLNTQLFNERNVPIPENGNWTYEQFVEALKQLTYNANKKKGADVFGFNSYVQAGSYNLYGFLMSDGAEVVSRDLDEYTFYGPQAVSGLQRLWELKHIYKVTPPQFGEMTSSEAWASFVNGKVAVYPANSWTIPYLRNLSTGSFEFTVANYPTGKEEVPVSIGESVCSFGVFKQKDENKRKMCIEFVKFLTAAEAQEELKKYGYFPVHKSGQELYLNDKEMSIVQKSLCYVEPIPRVKNWEQIDLILQSRVKAAINDELSSEKALEEAKELLQKYIR
ncbi:MAG: extracellular solute-binding protein [Lutisporaceae bacterium]